MFLDESKLPFLDFLLSAFKHGPCVIFGSHVYKSFNPEYKALACFKKFQFSYTMIYVLGICFLMVNLFLIIVNTQGFSLYTLSVSRSEDSLSDHSVTHMLSTMF